MPGALREIAQFFDRPRHTCPECDFQFLAGQKNNLILDDGPPSLLLSEQRCGINFHRDGERSLRGFTCLPAMIRTCSKHYCRGSSISPAFRPRSRFIQFHG